MNTQDIKSMSPEERQILNLRFSLAALLGTSLYNYGRAFLKISFDGFEELEAEAAKADERWLSALSKSANISKEDAAKISSRTRAAAGSTVLEQESPGQQTIQILTLLHPEIRKLFRTSAIYDIMSDTISRFDRPGETLEEQIDGMNLVTLSGIWIVTKRVFALGHATDCSNMIDCILALMKGTEQKPLTLSPVNDADLENVSAFYDTYFKDYKEPGSEPVEKKAEEAQAEEPTSITTFTSTDKLYLPSSKVFRKQQEIAVAGALGINVGRENSPVIVKASITDKDGKSPVLLTEFEMNIEATVGQMFQMNGYKTFKCTPAQIYRFYAGMEPGDPVSPTQVDKVVKAMDKLLTTPATLDFAEQLEKHTKLKKREGFDYTDTRRIGTLITGVHDQRQTHSYNGTLVEHTFTIHEMPMFYAYSYAIGQLYTVSKYLLTGATPPESGMQKKTAQKKKRTLSRNLSSDDIDLRRHLLRYIEYQRTEKEKRDQKYKRMMKPIPPYFEFFLPFETIAKELKYDADSPKKMRMLREQTYAFMQEQLKSPESPVTYADYYKKGKALHGVQIRI